MKLGIMQPYFFPYIGYWQLMNAVDRYVIYDDVAFIKNGWINRNRILVHGAPCYFRLPTVGAGSFVMINEIKLSTEKKLFDKLLRSLETAYGKAPFFAETMPLAESVITCGSEYMADLLEFQIRAMAKHLGMNTEILVSSRDVVKNTELHGLEKGIDICCNLGATEYYNAIGGMELYDKEDFAAKNIKLSFVKTNDIVYRQYKNDFVPNLSIIDVLMFNGAEGTRKLLQEFELV